jgi:hypothetical protein
MTNTDSGFHPINSLEEKIFQDKEFLMAIQIGKPRQNHIEGTIKAHIIHILEYIDKNYYQTEHYEDLRIIALLHDAGKFAFVEKYPDKYIITVSEREKQRLINISKGFIKKYYSDNISNDMKKYQYTSEHAYASYQFAKKFIKDQRLLKIIRYHDLAVDIKQEYNDTGSYNKALFKEIFTDIDIKTYQAFLKCDNCGRKDTTSKWFNTELKRNIISNN